MQQRTELIIALTFACCWTGVANAQASANAVTAAKDAFGFKTGDDSVGIYNEDSVRGFNLEAAGNYRVEGTYFVKNSGVSTFFLQSTTVRIGYNTLGTILPGPSGVVDYQLRDPAAGEPSTLTVGLDVQQQPFTELHFKHRTADDRASISLGLGRVFNIRDAQGGSGGKSILLAGAARMTFGDMRVRLFAGEYRYERPGQWRIAPTPDRLPAPVRRGRDLGQDWAMERGQRRIGGMLLDQAIGKDAGVGATLIGSQEDPSRGFLQLFRILDAEDSARANMIAVPHQRSTAWSGELRAHVGGQAGTSAHRFDLSFRGRRQRARFGGSEVLDLGEVEPGGRPAQQEAPDLDGAVLPLGASVDQWSLGLTYRGAFWDRLRVNAGLMTTRYRKSFRNGDEADRTEARPLLYNAAAAWQVTDGLELYASQSRGLEEAGVAPPSASNRNEVLNAILVSQRELGLRRTTGRWTAVVAAFATQKPYAGIESATGRYAILGDVRHRGIEGSVAAQPIRGVSLLLGGVLLDPQISGKGVTQGSPGWRPVGVPRMRAIANVDIADFGIRGLSFDAGVVMTSSRPVLNRRNAAGEQLTIGGSATFNAGARYRFEIDRRQMVVRAQVQNLLNSYSWEVNSSETLTYSAARRFRLLLTSNL